MSTPTTQTELVTYLIGQHRGVDQLFVQLEKMDGSTDEQAQRLAEQAVRSLVQHSVAEEIYLYPAAREHVPGGDEIADREVGEHEQVEQLMKRLEGLSAADADFRPTLHEVMREVRRHVDHEENDLFPKLREHCSQQQLMDLGRKVERAEKAAPTRPHPSSPSEGGALAAVAPGAGMVDRLRDALSGRGD